MRSQAEQSPTSKTPLKIRNSAPAGELFSEKGKRVWKGRDLVFTNATGRIALRFARSATTPSGPQQVWNGREEGWGRREERELGTSNFWNV